MKLAMSPATVDENLHLLAAKIKDAAKLDDDVTRIGPTMHAIEVVYTAHETSSLDVFNSFSDWLEDLSRFVRAEVAAARPRRRAASPSADTRPAPLYTRNTELAAQSTAPGGEVLWRSTQPPRQRNLQAATPPPADAPRFSLWENFRGPPQAQNAYASSSRPSAHDRMREACYHYDDSD